MRDTEWMYQKGYGIFVHYLDKFVNNPDNIRSMNKCTSWDKCIEDFDCDLFAKEVNNIGAGYVVFTMIQVSKHLIAPNSTFNKITGYKDGEACSSLDLVEKLYNALSKYNIDLLLYFTGDGPANDDIAGDAFGYRGYHPGNVKVTKQFVEKWASVLEEYSKKYGKKVKGWWLDGCYKIIGYDDELLKIMTDAARAGNADAVCGCNYYGVLDEYGCVVKQVRSGTNYCDFSGGEMVYLEDIPAAPFFENGSRWHILTHLGASKDMYEYNGWGCDGVRYSAEYLKDYYNKVHKHGGVVTLDICVYRDGHIDKEQMQILKVLKG